MIDEEKRARLSELQYCGINALCVNEIPFGVRAIQSGIEVEGIWISRPITSLASQIASSATSIEEPLASVKGKERWTDVGSVEQKRRLHYSSSGSITNVQTEDSSYYAPSQIYSGSQFITDEFGTAENNHSQEMPQLASSMLPNQHTYQHKELTYPRIVSDSSYTVLSTANSSPKLPTKKQRQNAEMYHAIFPPCASRTGKVRTMETMSDCHGYDDDHEVSDGDSSSSRRQSQIQLEQPPNSDHNQLTYSHPKVENSYSL